MQANSTGIRGKIISLIHRKGMLTLQELQEHSGCDLRKTRDNIRAAAADGLVVLDSDEVTGQPGYKLTDKGREWIAQRSAAPTEDAPQDIPVTRKTLPTLAEQIAECAAEMDPEEASPEEEFSPEVIAETPEPEHLFFLVVPNRPEHIWSFFGTFPEAKAHAIKNSREAVAEVMLYRAEKLGHTSLITDIIFRDAE